MRTERQKEQRLKYEQSEKGKLAKRKHDAAYKASGKRAETDRRRALRPISEARANAKAIYQFKRRSAEKEMDEFSEFVLREARQLCKLRKRMTGFDWHIDHIQPVSRGGTAHYTNLQVVPALWNRQKYNLHSNKYFN
jgi:hypothetical protein